MSGPPGRIWLQWNAMGRDCTWHWAPVDDTDAEYVKVERTKQPETKPEFINDAERDSFEQLARTATRGEAGDPYLRAILLAAQRATATEGRIGLVEVSIIAHVFRVTADKVRTDITDLMHKNHVDSED